MNYKIGDVVIRNGVKYVCKDAWPDVNPIIRRFEGILSLERRIGIKPTPKFARRLKMNRHAGDPKFIKTPSNRRYKKLIKDIQKRMMETIAIPMPRLDTPMQDGYKQGVSGLLFRGLPVLSPEQSNKKYFIGIDAAEVGSDKSSETIIDTHTGKVVGKEVLNG